MIKVSLHLFDFIQRKIIYPFPVALACISFINFSHAQLRKNKYDYPNINAIYSSHPDRPFKYGYTYNLQEIQNEFIDDFKAFGIKNGDIVADVGAASGWLEGVFSVLCDSVSFYVQDIDTVYSNQNELDQVVKYYSKLRSTPQTNTFHLTLGDSTRTNLPDQTFDVIILNNTFHELSNVNTLMNDLKNKLKPNGKLVIHEVFANEKRKVQHGGCNIPAYTVAEVIERLSNSGLYLTDLNQPTFSIENFLVFETNKEKALNFETLLLSSEKNLSSLYSLNEKKNSKSQKKLNKMKSDLHKEIHQNQKVFHNYQLYLYSLTNELYEQKDFKSAINIGFLLNEFYPENPENHLLLGTILSEKRQTSEALKQFQTVKKIDPLNMTARTAIIELNTELYEFRNGLNEFKSSMKLDPENAQLYAALGNLVRTKEYYLEEYPDYSKALDAYKKAIELDSLCPYYYELQADLQFNLDLMENSLKSINMAIYLNPFEKRYFKLRSKIYESFEQYANSEKDQERIKLLK